MYRNCLCIYDYDVGPNCKCPEWGILFSTSILWLRLNVCIDLYDLHLNYTYDVTYMTICTMCTPMYPHGSSDTCGGVTPCTVLKYGDCCMYSMSLGSSVWAVCPLGSCCVCCAHAVCHLWWQQCARAQSNVISVSFWLMITQFLKHFDPESRTSLN